MVGYYPDLEYARKWAEEDEDTPYFMDKSYLIWRFMIDKKYQGKGYGKEALQLALDYIRTFPVGEAGIAGFHTNQRTKRQETFIAHAVLRK